jgi:hypothetical protein
MISMGREIGELSGGLRRYATVAEEGESIQCNGKRDDFEEGG